MSGKAMATAVALLAPLLAGCIGASDDADVDPVDPQDTWRPGHGLDASKLTQATYGVLPKVAAYLPVSVDGIDLYAEVYLPDGDGPWPAILVSSPYHVLDHVAEPAGPFVGFDFRAFATEYASYGYAVVFADVRGTGNSEGCMDMMGAKEQQDQYDVVEWVAAQDWSDGKVGMWGVSYVGTTPHEAAIMAPPHLVTIATVAGVTNQWRNQFQNGVPYNGRSYSVVYEAGFGAPPPTDVARGPDWATTTASAACEQEDDVRATSPGVYEKGVYDAYWAERNITRGVGNVTVPVFYSQGFRDRAVNPMEAVHWFNGLAVPKKAFFHQGVHELPPRDDFDDTLHAWFDFWLKGIDNGVMTTPTVEVLTNVETIRLDEAWPPAGTTTLRLHLSPGALAETAPADGSETYVADHLRDPVTGSVFGVEAHDGALDLVVGAAMDGPTSLQFASEPLSAPLHMAGMPWMDVVASVDAPNTYFLAGLFDVDGDEWTEISEGWFNAHLHEGFDHSAPLSPGETYAFRYRFEPREYVFEEGHIIGLRLVGHDGRVFPFDEPLTRNTVYYGAGGSVLELPVLADPVTFEPPDTV